MPTSVNGVSYPECTLLLSFVPACEFYAAGFMSKQQQKKIHTKGSDGAGYTFQPSHGHMIFVVNVRLILEFTMDGTRVVFGAAPRESIKGPSLVHQKVIR